MIKKLSIVVPIGTLAIVGVILIGVLTLVELDGFLTALGVGIALGLVILECLRLGGKEREETPFEKYIHNPPEHDKDFRY